MKFELRDLEYFAAVAEHSNIGRAAEALGLSQPAVSKSLRRLEAAVQVKLVKRTPKGVALTSIGSALLGLAGRLRMSWEDVAREIGDLRRGHSGQVRIGVGQGSGGEMLAAACAAALDDAPNLSLRITVGDIASLLPVVRSGGLDFMITGVPESSADDLVHEALYDDDYVVYAAATHPLAKQKRVSISNVAEERWVLPAAHVLSWQWLHQAFSTHRLHAPRIAAEVSSVAIAVPLVAASRLLGFSSRRAFEREVLRCAVTRIDVRELHWHRRVGVIYRKDAYLSPAALRIIVLLKTPGVQSAITRRPRGSVGIG
jgi:DNA-binding transcriptional LysR family regulator